MTTERQVDRLLQDAGDLVEQVADTSGPSDLEQYAPDPVGFIRDVIGDEPWSVQEEVAVAVRDHAQVSVRSCHAAGKDWLAARLALWWVYARGGLVVLTGPTATQVEEILMRGEVREAFRRAGLPGELHVRALRPGGEGRAGILAKTAVSTSALTGFHDARVMVVITEAQDPEIEHAWDAAFAVATGAEDRILTLGNPTEQAGRFYRAHSASSDWRAFKVAGSDIPNVQQGEVVVPGLLTRQGVERFASEYGEESGFYQSRVLAEFPAQSEDGVFRRAWLEEAAEKHESGDRWLEEEALGKEPVAALDPARYGPDASVLAVRQGPVVRHVYVREGRESTTDLAEGVRQRLSGIGFVPERGPQGIGPDTGAARGFVVVDEVGLGGGVLDQLEVVGFKAEGFNGGRQARDSDRYYNRRAESFWTLRRKLERGEVALPRDEQLFEELLAMRWRPTPAGKVQLERKEDVKSRIGRSPDRADAVAMCLDHRGDSESFAIV